MKMNGAVSPKIVLTVIVRFLWSVVVIAKVEVQMHTTQNLNLG